MHSYAHGMFIILHDEGIANCDGKALTFNNDDAFLAPPGKEHVVENTGPDRLYALCTMAPNEQFAELIRAGTPEAFDDEDYAVLGGLLHATAAAPV